MDERPDTGRDARWPLRRQTLRSSLAHGSYSGSGYLSRLEKIYGSIP